ncbi:MAG: helix-turn-helix domain-containing protein [Bacteroidota bacterium]|nr:helix-turn-helix domain-containing protein [Bacteroidota bacterium]
MIFQTVVLADQMSPVSITFAGQSFFLYNLYTHIATSPNRLRQFTCGESLLTIFNCGLKNKYEDLWSHHNYIIYVVEGRKIWHTSHGSYDLREGSCVFVRKGACIVEQFFDTEFCFLLFFVPDEFICEVLKRKSTPIHQSGKEYDAVIAIDKNAAVQAFFQSMMAYFNASGEPDQSLLELKFRELILTMADNPMNGEILSYFCSLLKGPQNVSLQRVMEDNFCFNLKLEEFARLSSRSLSAFKRDFLRLYHTSPGKWLMEKRLNHALHLLSNMGKTVSEAAFESGFESASHFSRAFRQRFGTSPASVKLQTTT